MEAIFLVTELVLAVALVIVILMQRAEGGAAALTGGGGGAGGMGGFMTARGASNFLTRVTTWLAALFMVNCIILTGISGATVGGSGLMENPDYERAAPVEPLAPSVPLSE